MPMSIAPLDLAAVQIPYHFRCPISLELMRDPVTVATGQTYDRPSIESWIATGNTTCPVTRAPLPEFTLIPNHTLRRLIQEWCVAHRSLGVERIPTPKQPASPSLVRALVAQAASGGASFRLAALRRLRALARDSDKNRHVISTPENRAALLALAFDDPRESPSGPASDLALESLAVISMLPLSEQESAAVASRADGLSWLAGLLSSHPSAETRSDAAAMIDAVSTGTRSPDLRIAVGSTNGIMEGLLQMLDRDHRSPRAVKVAIKALFSLCLVKQNRERAVSLKAAESLIDRVASGGLDRGDLERALATVELLCRAEGGCENLAAHGGTVAALVKVLAAKVSDRAAEHAAGALAAVCGASEPLQREAVAKGVVVRLLLMVQSDCTERAKRKAQLLLKLLRAAWPHHDSLANSDDFQVQPAAAAAALLC